jgi:NTP pyrophosphatase (non-canonical NTP hydrolase)
VFGVEGGVAEARAVVPVTEDVRRAWTRIAQCVRFHNPLLDDAVALVGQALAPVAPPDVQAALERLTFFIADMYRGNAPVLADLALIRAHAAAGALAVEERALTFDAVTAVNLRRCARWHKGGINDWSISDWAVAMAGEAGETCNAVKKLRRVEDEIANISEATDRQLSTVDEAISKIGEELADTFLYLNLLACRLGLHLPTEIVAKFNATSERYGFPERLPSPAAAPEGRDG